MVVGFGESDLHNSKLNVEDKMRVIVKYPSKKAGHSESENVENFRLNAGKGWKDLIECRFTYEKDSLSRAHSPQRTNVEECIVAFTEKEAKAVARCLLNLAEGCVKEESIVCSAESG